MQHLYLQTCIVLGCLSLTPLAASGQEVVHAVAGTVISINPASKTFEIKTGDGSEGLFTVQTKSGVAMDFDKEIRAEATPASLFNKTKAQVVVYYFGDSDMRTAVAVEDLGPGPFITSVGSVVKFNRHERLLTIKNEAGQQESFHIQPKTVAETPDGVRQGERFDAEKGDQVRVVANLENGSETALFVRDL